jgi:hypothetical protein
MKRNLHILLAIAAINDKPMFSSERAPHLNKTATVWQQQKFGLSLQKELTPILGGRLIIGSNATLTSRQLYCVLLPHAQI